MMRNDASDQTKPPEDLSVLRKAIRDQDWEQVLSRLETHPDEAKIVTGKGNTCLFQVSECNETPVQVIQKLIDVFPEALCLDELPAFIAIEEAFSIQKIQLMVKAGPEALKMELEHGYGLLVHRIYYAAHPNKEEPMENWRVWRDTMKFALEYYPESAIRNANCENLLTWAATHHRHGHYTPEQEEIVDEVELLMYEAGYKALKSKDGVLPADHKFRPIHAAIELLHDRKYEALDNYCGYDLSNFESKQTQGFIRELKRCIYTNDEEAYMELWNRIGGRRKGLFQTCFLLGRYEFFVETMIERFPEQVLERDAEGTLPLQLAQELLKPYDFEVAWCKRNAPQDHIRSLITKAMSKFASDAVFEKLGVRPKGEIKF